MGNSDIVYSLNHNNKLEQGDILKDLPRISNETLKKAFDKKWRIEQCQNNQISDPDNYTEIHCITDSSYGVILTQDCDIDNGDQILFALLTQWNSNREEKNQGNEIINIIREQTKFHFFPKISTEGGKAFKSCFQELFILPKSLVIENLNRWFVARLIPPAKIVFKEKITKFFSRIAFEDCIFLEDTTIQQYYRQRTSEEKSEINNTLKSVGRNPLS